ncbi:ATP-binding protein [Geomobilimonas luticola]|uniref:histidine kinase n=1 Tax=Geomobilimonas luticola TaxID=1114878 RepID=A0ABS5SFA0_9BACT|nr:ATP-binding protein [Geomobilimonas luticola]MBT0654030.1 transporter substrate-binding domain-containing protein [Geomobilimonas luticola]
MLSLLFLAGPASATVHVRAGLEQNPPLSFTDSTGKASGLLVELLDHVADKEGWQLEFVPDTFDRCLEKLKNGDIDLMVTIAYSKERAELYDFNQVNVIANWGQLYSARGVNIQSYFDLDDKRIAVMTGDTHHKALRTMLEKFGIKATYLSFDNFDGVFNSLAKKEADAGVVGRFYALKNEDKYQVLPTPVIFNPIEVHYAVAQGKNRALIDTLDSHLELMKNDRQSVYYQALDRWLGVTGKRGIIPGWVKATLAAALGILLTMGAFNLLLRKQVRSRTHHLEQEIYERKLAEEALQAQFLKTRTIFDSINAVVYVASLEDNKLLYLNKQGRLIFGEDWQGKTCYQLFRAEQTDAFPLSAKERLIKDGIPQPPCEWEFWDPVSSRWYQCTDRAITWSDGQLVRLIIAFDISDHKELERTKDEMISAVSHEMRTPLTAMLGYLELVINSDIPLDQLRQFVRTAHTEAERLYEIIDNFLSIQRFNARNLSTPHKGPVNIASLIRETVALFGSSFPTHDITTSSPPDLPLAWGNAEDLHRVLNNLVSNAIKYSPNGGKVSITTSREDDTVVIAVRDEGIGIPSHALERIFERFYRVDNSDSRTFGGIGLGLALSKEIMTAHSGRIWVESAPGKGSTFFCSLPVVQDTPHDAEPAG